MSWSAGSDYLRYDVQDVDGPATVRLAGELDLASCGVLRRALTEAASRSADTILDLRRVTFIDAAGLRSVLTAQRDARAASHRLIIRRPHPALQNLFAMTGVLPFLELEDPRNEHAHLASSRDVVAIFDAAIETALQIDRADMGNAQLLDPQDRSLRIIAQRGFKRDFLQFFEIVDDEESACGAALNSGHPVWVPDTAGSEIFMGTPALDVMLDAGSRAVASLPVITPTGRLIAMISTHHNRRPARTNERKRKLEQLAHSTGRLIENLTPNEAPRTDHAVARNTPTDTLLTPSQGAPTINLRRSRPRRRI